MKLQIEVDTNDPDSIKQAMDFVLDVLVPIAEETPDQEQPKPAEVAPEKSEPSEKTEPTKQAGHTADDIRTKVSELIKDGKRTEVKELLSQFNADTVTKLKESDYANFMAAASLL